MSEVRVRVSLGKTQVEYVGSRAFFERAVAPLVDALCGAPRPRSKPSEPVGPVGPAWKPLQPQRFVQFASQVGPRAESVDQRIMAFAFYLWNFEKQDTCAADEIEAFFRTLRESPPEDLPERLERLTQSKRFLEPAEGDNWRLTTKGVNYVKNRLLGPSEATAGAPWAQGPSPS